ncbi:MAG: hypothetical protein ACI82S_002696 [Patiriisocius sp.]|jgi:hypothetical protein
MSLLIANDFVRSAQHGEQLIIYPVSGCYIQFVVKAPWPQVFLQWGAIVIELIGLLLVAIELYFPKTSASLNSSIHC